MWGSTCPYLMTLSLRTSLGTFCIHGLYASEKGAPTLDHVSVKYFWRVIPGGCQLQSPQLQPSTGTICGFLHHLPALHRCSELINLCYLIWFSNVEIPLLMEEILHHPGMCKTLKPCKQWDKTTILNLFCKVSLGWRLSTSKSGFYKSSSCWRKPTK